MRHNAHKRRLMKMAKKSGTQETFAHKLENGEEKEYLFQHPGIHEAVKLRGRSKDQLGHMDEEKYYNELMKHVIVSPRTNWEYWEENEGFMEVMKAASTFLNG